MLSFRRKLLLDLYKLSDIFILIGSLFTAYWLSTLQMNEITVTEFFSLRIKLINFIIFLGMIITWHLLFNSYRLYRSRRLNQGSREWKDVLKATTAGTIIFLLAGHFFGISLFTPLFMFSFWVSSTIVTVFFRKILRYVLNKARIHGRNLRFILIVGTNQRSYAFAQKIEERKELGYRVKGYVDSEIYLPNEAVNFLGTIDEFPDIIKNSVIDEVVITLPVKSCYDKIQKTVKATEEQGIIIRYLSDLFDTKIGRFKDEVGGDFPVMTMSSGYQDGWHYLAKRITDIVLASALIILTSPLMLFAAIAIILTSPGPAIYVQKRVGRNKRIFDLYKFRTMVAGADKMQPEIEEQNEMDGPVFKIRNDPRITRVGYWLRKMSIDELPQLFNVIEGNMSLVGPRPLPVRDYTGFNKNWQRRRFSVLPGITCTWQISGRNSISFEEWMKMDMEYIDNWKLSGDLKIILKTIPTVLKGEGS